MYRVSISALMALCLTGCASSQLNYNTVEIASTVDTVYARQTLNNLSKFIDDRYAIPSQMQLAGGVFQTVNTVNPSVSLPLSSQISKSAQSAATTGLTLTNGSMLAGGGLTLSGTNTAQQNYTVAPNVDAISLRNQQVLYDYAIYPDVDIKREYYPSRVFVNNEFHIDPFQLEEPHCILCADKPHKFMKDVYSPPVHVSKKLKQAWLLWDVEPRADLVPLGHYGRHGPYITKFDYNAGVLNNFILFTLNYTEPAETFSQGDIKPQQLVVQMEPISEEKGRKAPRALAPRSGAFSLPASPSTAPATNYKVPPVSPFNLIIPQQIQPQ